MTIPGYIELDAMTNFSFLHAASHAEEIVATAHQHGYGAVGIADLNSLAGVVRGHVEARNRGMRLLVGSRLRLRDGQTILVYPKDRAAYGRLSRLISLGRQSAAKGDCLISADDLTEHAEGQILIVVPPATRDEMAMLAPHLSHWKQLIGEDLYLAISNRLTIECPRRLQETCDLARSCDIAVVATGAVMMHTPDRLPLLDTLTCIRLGCTIDTLGLHAARNAETHLKPPAEIAALFRGHEDAVRRTGEVVGKIVFSLDDLAYNYPTEITAPGRPPQQELEFLTWKGAESRYPAGIPQSIRTILKHELSLIGEMRFAPYFLTVHDIVAYARSQNILCQGRGSAANSAVCYMLGITAIDPAQLDLLFERFISPERGEPPDIDVDFEHERREEVIQYVYRKYGRERAGLAATVIHYRSRRAIREVGKALGLSEDTVARLASQIWGWSSEGIEDHEIAELGFDPREGRIGLALALCRELIGFPRHLSQHVGGFVITEGRLDEIVPIENAAMEKRTVVQWDKDDLDALRILKVDILALGMLTCVRRAFELLRTYYGRALTLAGVPQDDPAVYDMLCEGDSLGVFQVESRAQMNFLPRMRPRNYYDLVIEVAIVRPGPIQGDMVHPYLRRRNGEEAVAYESDAVQAVLEKTLGVPLFQEQAMRLAVVAAGFTPAQADKLRRAMATFRKNGDIHKFYDKMIEGMVANGYQRDFAERCFKQIEGFGTYGFPESHAASFALLVYISAWLKCHYPDVFCAALLNSQPMGFYAPAQIVRDAREHGVSVHPPDVNFSQWDCMLEPEPTAGRHAVRLGLRQIKGLGEDDASWIVAARGNGYVEPADVWRRAGLNIRTLKALAHADAFASMGLNRREALWHIKPLEAAPLPLFEAANEPDFGPEPPVTLPPISQGEAVAQDYRSLRLSLRAHPLALLRETFRDVAQARELAAIAPDTCVTVAGLVLVRQRPGSAKGVIFITLEDETGVVNLIVWPKTFERFRRIVLTARLLQVRGRLQREGKVMHVIAEHLTDRSGHLDTLGAPPLPSDSQPAATLVPALAHADEVAHPVPPERSGAPGRQEHKFGHKRQGAATPPRPTPRPTHPRDQARILFPSRDFH